MSNRFVAIAVIVLLLTGLFVLVIKNQNRIPGNTNQNTNQPQNSNTTAPTNDNTNTSSGLQTFKTSEIEGADDAFRFSAAIPSTWAVEAVTGSQALNLYDPAVQASSNLERSQIFVKYFAASRFLTLTTVDIIQRTESTINNRSAVTYTIQKKSGVANFPSQPSWRNELHRVTDIRSSDASPTTFYVFAKAPGLSDETFEAFLESIRFDGQTSVNLTEPIHDFKQRVTKKRFGQRITPDTSPVQPERFSGFHTGIDAETSSEEAEIDVPIYAITNGTVRVRQTASGYGGVVLIEHAVNDETVTAVYGHVRLSSVEKHIGQTVKQGERIAVLGTGGSNETDGERKHLHFAILKGKSDDLRGYVASASELSAWYDPLAWLADPAGTMT